ncbi:MAG: thermostable hemolysin [Roseicyclus sp.]|uniref:thermostable hemolysin n=1 Tax=Roseicyclus sp. TaxID=1914329 RepID=UPI003A8A3C1C
MQTLVMEDAGVGADRLYERALDHMSTTYKAVFAAEVTQRPPRLVITMTDDGRIACAAGIRCHADGFFSQHYLDETVSDALTRQASQPVLPQDLLEVGSLACISPFSAYPTLRAVFDWGRARGIGWGLFTATAEIRRLILRARITPVMLARAEAGRVPNADAWGNYYDHDPWVCAFRDPAQVPSTAPHFAEIA